MVKIHKKAAIFDKNLQIYTEYIKIDHDICIQAGERKYHIIDVKEESR